MEEYSVFSLASMEWEVPTVESLLQSPIARFIGFSMTQIGYTGSMNYLICTWVHPLMLQAKAEASKEDNPTWWQAMNGPFSAEYWQAACVEVETLEEMDAWEIVD